VSTEIDEFSLLKALRFLGFKLLMPAAHVFFWEEVPLKMFNKGVLFGEFGFW